MNDTVNYVYRGEIDEDLVLRVVCIFNKFLRKISFKKLHWVFNSFWFQRFKSGNFNANDKERARGPKEIEDNELYDLLEENSAQTLQELSNRLEVTFRHLYAMEEIQKTGKWIPYNLKWKWNFQTFQHRDFGVR